MVMAMGKSSTTLPEATLRNSGLVRSGLLSLLAVPGLGLLQLTSGTTTSTIGTAIASSSKRPPESPPSNPQPPPPPSTIAVNTIGRCGVNFLFPKGKGLEFYHLDTLNVTYQSSFANPTLHCWCRTELGSEQVTEQFIVNNASPFHGSVLVPLNFSSTGPCWFDLRSDDSQDCRDRSEPFALSPKQRHFGRALPTIGLASPVPRLAPRATSTDTSSSTSPTTTKTTPPEAVATQGSRGGGESLGTGARVGLAIGITLICLGVVAMAAFLYFRRRRRHQDASLASAIIDHDQRHGRKGPEKPVSRNFAPSINSGNSDEPLYPIQPVFDGYPGSMGYDDVRSLESSTQGHSPTVPHSPTLSQNTGHWAGSEYQYSGRDELTAARLNSQSVSVVTSYGPNPVTPTLTPRPSSRVDLNVRAGNVSVDSREDIPPMPGISIMPEYITYGMSHQSIPRMDTNPSPSPPRKAAPPIVVSYGPNRVTPTPAVTTPTVPLDDAIVKRRIQNIQNSAAIRSIPQPVEHQNSWDEEDEPMMAASTMGPLPPYASTEDFYAMEKGAIRKLEEPEAHELPPTKDGFYHYASDVVEYELPGSSIQHEPQLPYDPYRQRIADGDAGPSNGRSGGWRDIDEQKFLLSDVEMAKLRAEKVKARAKMATEQKEPETYKLEEVSASGSRR